MLVHGLTGVGSGVGGADSEINGLFRLAAAQREAAEAANELAFLYGRLEEFEKRMKEAKVPRG